MNSIVIGSHIDTAKVLSVSKLAKGLFFLSLRAIGISWGSAFVFVYGGVIQKALHDTIARRSNPSKVLEELKTKIWQEVGFVPDEGEVLVGNIIFKRILTDRDANLELGLFTNVAPGETITEATITEPTGTGYARIDLVDATWAVASSTFTYTSQVFTGGAGGWTGSIQGYFISTKAAGGTQRLIGIEVDASGPYTIAENDTYTIDLANTPA